MKKNRRVKWGALLFGIACCLVFTACSAQSAVESATPVPPTETPAPTEEPTPVPTETATPEPEPTYRIVGENTEGAYHVLFTNRTEGDMVGLQIKESDAADFEPDLLTPETGIMPGETFELCYTPSPAAAATVEAPTESVTEPAADGEESGAMDVMFNTTWDMSVVLSNGTEFTLHDLGFGDMREADICFSTQDNVGYVEYDSIANGDKVNTLEAEIFYSELSFAQTAEPTATEKSSSGSSSSSSSSGSSDNSGSSGDDSDNGASTGGGEPTEPEPPAPDPEPAPDNDSSGGAEEPAPDQGSDGCLEDGVIWND